MIQSQIKIYIATYERPVNPQFLCWSAVAKSSRDTAVMLFSGRLFGLQLHVSVSCRGALQEKTYWRCVNVQCAFRNAVEKHLTPSGPILVPVSLVWKYRRKSACIPVSEQWISLTPRLQACNPDAVMHSPDVPLQLDQYCYTKDWRITGQLQRNEFKVLAKELTIS